MGIESYAAALALGWRDIRFAPDLPMANLLGLCPDCLALEEEKRNTSGGQP